MGTSVNWSTAGKGSIGASGVPLIDDYVGLDGINYRDLRPVYGVQIYADSNNAQPVMVGRSDITAATGAMTAGYPIEAGKTLLVPTTRVEDIYVIATNGATGLAVNYIIT